MRFDVDAFHVQWKNVQQNIVFPCAFGYIDNTGNATVNGFDASLSINPVRALTLSGSVSYAKSTFSGTVLLPGFAPGTPGSVVVRKGDQVNPYLAPWNLTGSVEYRFAIGRGEARIKIEDIFRSRNPGPFTSTDPNAIFYDRIRGFNPATNQINARATVAFGDLELAVFAQNLTNARPILFQYRDAATTTLFTANTFTPRTIGLSADYRFSRDRMMKNTIARNLIGHFRRRTRAGLLAAAFSGLACAGALPALAQAPVPVAQTQDPAEMMPPAKLHEQFFAKRLTGYLSARDGTQLRYSVLLPKGKGPFPVIVNYSGYDPGSIGGKAYMNDNTAMSVNLDRSLVQAGYAVVGVQARGTACSEGQFEFLARSYGEDGYDAIEWIARQPWSNGAVGMANWSWAGMSQLATASETPPHLKAIAPGMVLGDARLDSWAPGGVPAPGFVDGWWDYLHSRWEAARQSAEAEGDKRCLAQIATNLETAEANRVPSVLIRHPLRDDYIEIRHLAGRTGNINVPVFNMEAFQDEAVIARQGYFHETLKPDQLWYLQTNGGHDLYVSTRFRKQLIAFFDRFVKGKANGFEQTPHVQVWIESTFQGPADGMFENLTPGITLQSEKFPMQVKPLSLALSGGGVLAPGEAGSGAAEGIDYPIRGPAVQHEFFKDSWGPLDPAWRKGSLAFTTAPLGSDLLTYGPASADLWVTTTGADADLQVTVTEVRPDGQEMYVQRGWLRLSDRRLDPARTTPLRPWLADRPETMAAMVPGKPALARIEIQKFSHAFRKGSRLRVWIDTPSQFGGNLFAPYSVPTRIEVLHDADHPSRILIGTLEGVAIPPQRPVCGTVHHQPCRPDPLASMEGKQP